MCRRGMSLNRIPLCGEEYLKLIRQMLLLGHVRSTKAPNFREGSGTVSESTCSPHVFLLPSWRVDVYLIHLTPKCIHLRELR